MTTCRFQRLSCELNLQCSFFRSSSVEPTNRLWPQQEPVIPQLMYPKHHFCIFFMTKYFFYFSLWPWHTPDTESIHGDQSQSLLSKHDQSQKSKQNNSKTKYCTKRHEWEGCKSCNYSTLQRSRAENTT